MPLLEELEQLGVDEILVGREHPVRSAFEFDQPRAFHQLDRLTAGDIDRHDLVVVAVQHQGGHVELLEVGGEVALTQ